MVRTAISLVLLAHVAISPAYSKPTPEKPWVKWCGLALLTVGGGLGGFYYGASQAVYDQPSAKRITEERETHFRLRAEEQIARATKNGQKWEASRNLKQYDRAFKGELRKILATLGPHHHWIDMGSGEGIALIDYHREGGLAHTTGITFERAPVTQPDPERMRSLVGEYVENISAEKIIGPVKPNLITDLAGPLSYSADLIALIKLYYSLLDDNGVALIALSRTNIVVDQTDKSGFLTEWLSSHSDLFTKLPADEKDGHEILVLHKKQGVQLELPQLDTILFEPGLPPARVYWANHGKYLNTDNIPIDATLMDRLKKKVAPVPFTP